MGNIFKYVFLTYLISWLSWGAAAVITQKGFMVFSSPIIFFLFILGGISPALSALVINKFSMSVEDFIAFKKNILQFRVAPIWYLAVFVLGFFQCLIPFLIDEAVVVEPIYMIFLILPLMVIGGGLEEIGWRGFLLPALMRKISPLSSTILIGVIWSFWHFPLWFIIGTMQESMIDFGNYFFMVMGISFILSAVYIYSGSIFLCILLHALINATLYVCVPTFSLLCCVAILVFDILAYMFVMFLLKRRFVIQQKSIKL